MDLRFWWEKCPKLLICIIILITIYCGHLLLAVKIHQIFVDWYNYVHTTPSSISFSQLPGLIYSIQSSLITYTASLGLVHFLHWPNPCDILHLHVCDRFLTSLLISSLFFVPFILYLTPRLIFLGLNINQVYILLIILQCFLTVYLIKSKPLEFNMKHCEI